MLIRAVAYFSIVFCVGFVLGTIRVLWLVPQFGDRLAELIEAPLMLVAIFYSARFVTQRFPSPRALEHLVSGLLALALLLVFEFAIVLNIRGLSISQYLAGRDPVAGLVYVGMLMVFAAMPWFVGKRRATE